jgi:argininosuccinate lyase
MTGSYTVLHNVGYMDTEEVEIETYRPLFEALELAYESLPSMTELVRVMKADRELMLERTAWGFSTVTALAESIQLQCGLSYRTAHRIVARSVLLASEDGKDARGIDQDLINEAALEILGHPLELDAESIRGCHEPIEFVRSHAVAGAPAPEEVKRMLAERQKLLKEHAQQLQKYKDAVAAGEKKLSEAAAALT